jgi:hypothetical protein
MIKEHWGVLQTVVKKIPETRTRYCLLGGQSGLLFGRKKEITSLRKQRGQKTDQYEVKNL